MDIVEWLRREETQIATEAADEIERLREKVKLLEQTKAASNLASLGLDVVSGFNAAKEALLKICKERSAEIERLREALKNFCDAFEPHLHPERCQYCSNAYWEARAALKGDEK